MDPIFLHSGHEPQGGHRDLVGLFTQLELMRESHNVKTRIHGGNVDAESLREPSQEQIKKIFNR